jgi:hypothetical protein
MITLDLELVGVAVMILIVGLPLVIALLGPTPEKKEIKLIDIVPLLQQAIHEYASLQAMRYNDYDAFEDEVIRLLYARVQSFESLKDYKGLLTHSALRILMGPYLQKIFNKK